MRSLPLTIERTVDHRDLYERLRWIEARLEAAYRLIAELERKLGERPPEERLG